MKPGGWFDKSIRRDIMKIVILDGYTENPGDLSWQSIEELAGPEGFAVYDHTPPEEILARMEGAGIVLTNKTPISAGAIAACPELRYIGVLATGYNVVDVAAAKAHGVTVTNIPTYGTSAVAQYTMALLLELCHHVGAHSDSVRRGDWARSRDFCYWNFPLVELAGKTMGLIGYGRIGQAVGRLAGAFGMEVLAYTRPEPRQPEPGVEFVSLEELLRRSDAVSLHCPLFPENTGMINGERLSLMKEGAFLLNTARGPLIDEAAVAGALKSGRLGGAALDVVSVEPIKEDNPLLGAPNCLITPHIAWAARESRARLMDIAAENLKSFLAGRPVNVVGQ